MLSALRNNLMDEALCEEFCKTDTARVNELRIQHNASLNGHRAEMARLEKAREEICDSICNGVPTEFIKDRAIRIQNRREELEKILASTEDAPVLFHPNMADAVPERSPCHPAKEEPALGVTISVTVIPDA